MAFGILETGGLNSLEPLLAAARTGVAVVDADGMGRAFPELQMCTPFIYGLQARVASICDCRGKMHVKTDATSPKDLEDVFREHVVAMGCVAGICLQPMTGGDVRRTSIPHTLSQSRTIGAAVLAARSAKTSPHDAVAATAGGRVLFIGTVTDVTRTTEGGFNRGTIAVEGRGGTAHAGQTAVVEFQNENLVRWC